MKKISVYISEDNLEFIDSIKKEFQLSSRNKTIDKILNDYRNNSNNNSKKLFDYLSSIISDNISKELTELNSEIKRLRFAQNSTDKNTLILLNMINGFYHINNNYDKSIPPVDIMPTTAYEVSLDFASKKIERDKYKKEKSLY